MFAAIILSTRFLAFPHHHVKGVFLFCAKILITSCNSRKQERTPVFEIFMFYFFLGEADVLMHFWGCLLPILPQMEKKKNKKNPISYKTHELFSNSFVQCNFYGICIGSQGYTLIHFWAIQTLKLSGFSPNTGTSTHSTLLYLHVRSLKYFSWNQWFHAQRQQKDISSFREFTSGKKAKCRGGTRKKVQASLMMC